MPRRLASMIAGCLLHLAATSAYARPARRAAPPQPTKTETVTLHQAIEAAWARYPQRRNFAAQQNVAAANYVAGSALFPNAPTATGSYVNDKLAGSNYNYITSQIGVSTPIWLPGEGTATQRAAAAQGTAIEGQTVAEHYALARRIVSLAANAADALNARAIAERRVTTNRALATDLARQFGVGESSQSDALAADADASSAQVSLAQAEAQLAAAKAALATATGSDAVPLLVAPDIAAASVAVPPDHPMLRAAEQQVQAAAAQERLTDLQDRDDPELGVQGINEKQPGTRWDTRFGVTVTFHFATEARNAPRRAEAAAKVTQAQVQLELVRRQIAAEITQARAVLVASDRAVAAADRGAADLDKRRGQIERAWRLGEMPFVELVRANALAFDAAAARDKARTTRAAAVLDLGLAEGIVP